MNAAYWITSGALCIAGIAVMTAGFLMPGKNEGESFTKTFEYADSIDIGLSNCTVYLKTEDTNEFTVEFENVYKSPKAYMEGDTLFVRNQSGLYLMSFGWMKPSGTVTITVPEQEYTSILLNLDAIKLASIENIQTKALDIDLDASTMRMTDITVTEKTSLFDLDAGYVTLENCIFKNAEMDMDASTLTTDSCTFEDMNLDADAASINMNQTQFGSLLDANLDAASLDFKNCLLHRCFLDVDAGDVEFRNSRLQGDLEIDLDAGSADLEIDGKRENYCIFTSGGMNNVTVDGSNKLEYSKEADYVINVTADAGDVDITFLN